MPNKSYALEWLQLANRNLETARLLLRENHYTDSIAIELQQSVEKAFKAIYAFYGISIPRTHALPILYNFVSEKIAFEDILSTILLQSAIITKPIVIRDHDM